MREAATYWAGRVPRGFGLRRLGAALDFETTAVGREGGFAGAVLGFQPTADGYEVNPRLPKAWPSLKVSGIHFHDQVLEITARANGRVETKEQRVSTTAKP